jgi:hypothetical protein
MHRAISPTLLRVAPTEEKAGLGWISHRPSASVLIELHNRTALPARNEQICWRWRPVIILAHGRFKALQTIRHEPHSVGHNVLQAFRHGSLPIGLRREQGGIDSPLIGLGTHARLKRRALGCSRCCPKCAHRDRKGWKDGIKFKTARLTQAKIALPSCCFALALCMVPACYELIHELLINGE